MKVTDKKRAANRANAQKSTGPVSPAGKENSSRNAITHGITARTLLIRTESESALLNHLNAYLDLFEPQNQLELDLVAVLVATSWRLRRCWCSETGLLDVELSRQAPEIAQKHPQIDHESRTALAFRALADQSAAWTSLDRYETRLRRAFRSALHDLQRLRHPTPGPDVAVIHRKMQNEAKNSNVLNIRNRRAAQSDTPPRAA